MSNRMISSGGSGAGAETDSPVGTLLRGWRLRRRLSQLDLSIEADTSTRHLSWVETGRSRPTPEMILRLAEAMEVPLRERNQLLLAGGFAPRYPDHGLDAPALSAVRSALSTVLAAHLPHPALVFDRWWTLVDSNEAVDGLLAGCAMHLLRAPVNVLRLSLHPEGLAPRIENLGQWRAHLLEQLHQRQRSTGDPALAALEQELLAYPGPEHPPVAPTDVVLPLRIRLDGGVRTYFSVASTVQSAGDISVSELTIETFYPMADDSRSDVP